MEIHPTTVHEAEVAVFHAWGDGVPVAGPLRRHRQPAITDEFRVGLKFSQVSEGGEMAPGFGEWRRNAPQAVSEDGWMVEMASPFGAVVREITQLSSIILAGSSVVVVVRFRDTDTGFWRLLQFHDAVALPGEVGDQSEAMMRSVKFSAGWMEEMKSGEMPDLLPRLRGVVEWRHLGRVVRCWEYDASSNVWTEDEENHEVIQVEDAPLDVRYVTLDFIPGGEGEVRNVSGLSYLFAGSRDATMGGYGALGIGWGNMQVFGSSGLTEGWAMEEGCAEPIYMPVSGQDWEHPRVVIRFLGRIYATIQSGVVAVPAKKSGAPGGEMDYPIRMGPMVFYPTKMHYI